VEERFQGLWMFHRDTCFDTYFGPSLPDARAMGNGLDRHMPGGLQKVKSATSCSQEEVWTCKREMV